MDHKSLDEALLAARRELGPTVHKGGWNQAQKFNYVGHEQVVKAVRASLQEHDLIFVQTSVEFKQILAWTGKSGPQNVMLWEGMFQLRHRGTTVAFGPISATTQAGDKAAFIASTALDRTALLRLLGLAGSADEDPEHNSHDEQTDPRTGETPASQNGELPQQQGDQWQQADDAVVLARLKSDMELMHAHVNKLASTEDPGSIPAMQAMAEPLTDWSAELFSLRTKQSKSPLWAAFGRACQAAALDPQVISGAGRKKAAESAGAK